MLIGQKICKLHGTENMECKLQQQRPVGVFRQPAPQPGGRFGGGQQHTLLPQPKAPQVIAFLLSVVARSMLVCLL